MPSEAKMLNFGAQNLGSRGGARAPGAPPGSAPEHIVINHLEESIRLQLRSSISKFAFQNKMAWTTSIFDSIWDVSVGVVFLFW